VYESNSPVASSKLFFSLSESRYSHAMRTMVAVGMGYVPEQDLAQVELPLEFLQTAHVSPGWVVGG
jgi:hypothetical protein